MNLEEVRAALTQDAKTRLAEMRAALSLAREFNLKRLEAFGMVAILGKDYEIVRQGTPIASALAEKIGLEHGNPTEDEMMFWSSGEDPTIKTEPLELPHD